MPTDPHTKKDTLLMDKHGRDRIPKNHTTHEIRRGDYEDQQKVAGEEGEGQRETNDKSKTLCAYAYVCACTCVCLPDCVCKCPKETHCFGE